MTTIEMNSTAPEEDQKDSSNVLTEITTPNNFALSAAADFGISVQSFIPASLPSPNRKEKSRLAQLKQRRRSNIGVRGSPETNSLIRFIAQQRMKTPPAQATPEFVIKSPFLPRVASTLRQKMACFQSLMGVEDGAAAGCVATRDDLSAGKENHPPSMALPPNKKRRLGPTRGCEDEITEDDPPPLHFSLDLEEKDRSVKDKALEWDKTEEASAQALVISPPEEQLWSSTESQQEVVSELERSHQPRPDDPSAVAAAQPASHFPSPSLSSLLEMKPAAADSLSSPTLRRKKQVRFGEPLPPELFDKSLPPSTPLRKGGTPARAATPGGALKLRSLLKTPQREDSPSTQQAELTSPSMFASPTLSMPRCRRMAPSEDDREEEMSGKIPFPMEEIENEAAIAEESLNVPPLKLEAAFNEDFFSHSETESETKAVDSRLHEALQDEEPQTDTEAAACGTSSTTGGKATQDTEASTRSGGRKRKLPEESEPVKRSSRSAAKTASGKMKESAATRRWNKKVDRSLYGSREYASKEPLLSPITESRTSRLSSAAEEPEADAALSQAPHVDLGCNGKSVSGDPAPQTGDTTAPNDTTTLQTSPWLPAGDRKNGGARRSRRRSGSKGVGRAVKGRKVSVNDERAAHGRNKDDYAERGSAEEEKTTRNEVESAIGLMNLLDASIGMNEELETPVTWEKPTSEEPTQALGEVDSGQGQEPDKMNREVESGRLDDELNRQESTQSRSDEHEDGAATATATLSLPPWQDDFNLEDVFKPVPTRGQRSVRRSLRNQSGTDHGGGGGLAWLPHVSPESMKESRRRTRGRRLSAALPTLALEVTQP